VQVTDGPAPQPAWASNPAPRVYANVVGLSGGPFDVMLIFGLQQAASPSDVMPGPIEEVMRVSMSWGHAKSMIPLLARLVADYESKYGELPAPGFDDTWRS
jgi:hypothetical protein